MLDVHDTAFDEESLGGHTIQIFAKRHHKSSKMQSSLELEGNRLMNVMTFTEARAGLKQVMDDVCADHQPVVVTRQRGENVVVMSLTDFNSMTETLHLLSSPINASRLRDSMAQLNAGQTTIRELTENGFTQEKARGRT